MCQQKRQLGGRQMLEIFNNMPFLAEAKRGSSCGQLHTPLSFFSLPHVNLASLRREREKTCLLFLNNTD
jgi:hypothetical protein